MHKLSVLGSLNIYVKLDERVLTTEKKNIMQCSVIMNKFITMNK